MKAMLPERGIPGAKVRLSFWPGRIQPRQLGPSTRMGWSRSQARSSASRVRPSPPISRKPAEITTAPRTPLATHSFNVGQDLDGRYRDDGEVDGFLEVENGGDGR